MMKLLLPLWAFRMGGGREPRNPDRLWKLESSALEQQKVQSQQENTIKQLEQVGTLSLANSDAEECY